jgi:hypothetical protein
MSMFLYRLLSKLMLLIYFVLMAGLAWDIVLLTPNPGARFEQLVAGGAAIVLLPVFLALFVRKPATLAVFNVMIGTAMWFLAALLWFLLSDHASGQAMCHAVHANQTQMIPQIGQWIQRHTGI